MGFRSETLVVRRTARYYVAGPPPEEARAAWMVLHGYGERAEDFATDFEPIVQAGSCVVAPEALSRFYTDHASDTVGASWMTRADREHEIADYLAYLDRLAEAVMGEALGRGQTPLHVLGFSQGAATAARWAAHRLEGGRRVERLVLWGGALPPEVAPRPLKGARLVLVAGTRDAFLTPGRLQEQRARLDDAGARYALLRFEGGHRLDDDTLGRLAEAGAKGCEAGEAAD